MRRTALAFALSLVSATLLLGADVVAAGPKGKGHENFKIKLKGFEEAPVVVTDGSGTLELEIDDAAGTIEYELTYEDLEGDITQAHIHIGQKNVSGGIALWLCQTPGTQAPLSVRAATPQCDGARTGKAKGTLTAASVLGPAGQGVPVGSLADVLTAIRAGKAYGNVHTTVAGSGEIRGQVH